jgi:type IV pilus assembly protein PilA
MEGDIVKGFSLIELLIVMAIIAALISALVPVGLNVVKHAYATTVALNLSEISKAVMSDFYLNHNTSISIDSVKSYFSGGMYKSLKKFKIKTVVSTNMEHVYIWYDGNDITASEVKKILPSVTATRGNKPMLSVELEKYW